MKKISIVTPTYNEEDNIQLLCDNIKKEFSKLNFDYEHIVIDNNSKDQTVSILRNICKKEKNLKVIVNNKKKYDITSPFYGLLQSSGDATILIASDFQDPIELIPQLIKKWEEDNKVVFASKKSF